MAAAAFLAVFAFAAPASLAATARHAAMVIDANTGKVLHEANADEPRYPASLTKLMTLYLVFEALDQNLMTLDTQLVVSEAAASVAPSKLDLKPGETISVADAIKALVTKSANDMAVAMAEKISGSEAAFATLMTNRARQIGMKSTTFRNASGLPDPDQVTTAHDMLTLALRIQDDFPSRARVFSLREFTYQGKTYRTHNTLMKTFPGMDGMKTGYTQKSGFNLVSSVRRDGKHLVAAVFGGATASARNAHMRQILTHALDEASTEKTRVAKPQLIARARQIEKPKKQDPAWPAAKVALAQTPKPAVRPAAKPPEAVAVEAAPKAPAKPVAVAAAVAPPVKVAAPPPVPAPALAPAPVAPPVEQSVSVAPPAEPAPSEPPAQADPAPAQSVSVAPPIAVASVKTIDIKPEPVAAAPNAAPASAPEQSVSVAPPPAAPQPAPAAREFAAASASPKLDFAALRRAVTGGKAAPAPAPEPVAVSVLPPPMQARPPSSLNAQLASLNGGAPAEPSAVGVSFSKDTIGIGSAPARAPSTLEAQAQAQAIAPAASETAAAAQPQALGGPASGLPAVQIGAYASAQDAERQLAAVQAKAGAALIGANPVARRIQSNGKALYAARFAGFDQASANKACVALKSQAIDCFVVTAK